MAFIRKVVSARRDPRRAPLHYCRSETPAPTMVREFYLAFRGGKSVADAANSVVADMRGTESGSDS